MKKSIAGIVSACALAASLTFVSPGVAKAAPSSCATGWNTDGNAYGNCSTGTGQYRLGIPCKFIYGFTAYGPWSNVNVPSTVGCPPGSSIWWDIPGGPQIWVEKRN